MGVAGSRQNTASGDQLRGCRARLMNAPAPIIAALM
jgi:hypothetical protein